MINTWFKVWSWFSAVMIMLGAIYCLNDRSMLFVEKMFALSWGAWAMWAAHKIQHYPVIRKIEVEEIEQGK